MHHLAAFFSTTLSTTANTDLPALTDDILNIQNNHFLPGENMQLLWASAGAATLNRCRLTSATLRQVSPPFIRPINNALVPSNFMQVADYRQNPFTVRGLEELAAEATSDIAMGNEDGWALIGLSPGMTPVPAGDIYTMRGTSTTAATADTWTTITTTFADTIPQGRFACVGLEVIGAAGIGARLIFDNQIWRPGCVLPATIDDTMPSLFRKGRLGQWGVFETFSMPRVQVLSTAATAVWDVYLDLVRIA